MRQLLPRVLSRLRTCNSGSLFCQPSVRYSKSVVTMRVLNVAEKNDAAKNIAGYLSRGTARKREGLSVYNKIYEFNVQLWNSNCEMIMTSVSGHLLGYEFLGAYRKWYGCHPLSLFDAPVVKQCIEGSSIKIKNTLEREIKKCGALIIWTDCDREGENIGFEIIQVCQAYKPNIRIYRAKFSEITQASVQRALQNLEQPVKAVSDAVDVRSELDLRIGAAFTRFQTLRLQKVFPTTLTNMLISYGSCQFPTLGFVVERYLAIETFQSEPYWKVKVVDIRGETTVEFRWERVRLFEKLPCEIFFKMCRQRPTATVLKVMQKPKTKWRPLPLDTIELEKQGSRMLHMNAKETMKVAEKLYTQGLISYPRTETNIFPKDMNLVDLVRQQVENSSWGDFAEQLLNDGLSPREGKKSDQAHPPIHPIKYTDSLQGNEAKVYEFVVRHFLACVSRNAVGQETTVEISIAGEKFHANGLLITEKNYLNVYIYQKWNDKDIHDYKEGETFRPSSIDMVEEETSPPRLLTEADLITLMDRNGIGTDATHAEHIDTIKSRQYVGLTDGNYFMPGKLGIGLVMGYDNMGVQMSKPHLRAELENDLKLICNGQKDPKVVLQSQIDKYRDLFKIALESANLIDRALGNYLDERPSQAEEIEFSTPQTDVAIFTCPKCRQNMTLREKKNDGTKYIGCMGYPTCNNAIWFPQSVENIEVLAETCSECRGNMRTLKFKLARNAFPVYGTEYVTCIGGCDSHFNELFNIKSDSVKRSARMNDTGYSSMSDTRSTTLTGRSQGRSGGTSASSAPRTQGSNTSVESSRNQRPNRGTGRGARNTDRNNKKQSKANSDDGWSWSGPSSSTRNEPQSESPRTWGTVSTDDVYVCNCNEEARKLTVKKEGPNQGRTFYTCPKPMDRRCNFFLWGDDGSTQQGDSRGFNQTSAESSNSRSRDQYSANNSRPSRNNDTSWSSNANSSSSIVMCNCNAAATLLTVTKTGANTGRQFYGCPKGANSSCKFFQWADENSSGQGQSQSTHRRQNFGNRNNGDDSNLPPKRRRVSPTGKRKCGICGEPGHTRRTCPNNMTD